MRIASGGPYNPKHDEAPLNVAEISHKSDGDIVVRFNVSTIEEERALAREAHRNSIDVWAWDQIVDFRIKENKLRSLLDLLPETLHESYSVLIEDLPAAISHSYPSAATNREDWHQTDDHRPRSPGHGEEGLYFFRNYQPHNVVLRWMRLLEAMFPTLVRYTTVGESYEGREIPALIVSDVTGSRDPSVPRKTLVVMGGSHAREWISTTTVNYLAWAFITSYGRDRLITKFLQEFDIIFLPEMNPDGIEYTWHSDRLWRKSRQPSKLTPWCFGLDLDHAFGYEWDSWRSGHTDDPCSESYAGQEPWESVEVSAFRDWAKHEAETNNIAFVGLLDLHSYSQQILFPYAYSCDIEPPNLEKMEELALGLAKSIRLFSGETYSVKPACQGAGGQSVEPSGGSAIDWFYHELSAHYSYQIKLRDTGSYGFLLPPEEIIPTGDEILQAMKYLGDFLLGNNGIENLQAADGGAAREAKSSAAPEDAEDVLELR